MLLGDILIALEKGTLKKRDCKNTINNFLF